MNKQGLLQNLNDSKRRMRESNQFSIDDAIAIMNAFEFILENTKVEQMDEVQTMNQGSSC